MKPIYSDVPQYEKEIDEIAKAFKSEGNTENIQNKCRDISKKYNLLMTEVVADILLTLGTHTKDQLTPIVEIVRFIES